MSGLELGAVNSRWVIRRPGFNHSDAVKEVGELAQFIETGVQQLHGTYMRLCDLIREYNLTDDEVRKQLSPHFPAPRISEVLKVAHAPEEIYNRYKHSFIGFRAALQQCRLAHITPSEQLRRKRMLRAAQRLVELSGGAGEVEVCGYRVQFTKVAAVVMSLASCVD